MILDPGKPTIVLGGISDFFADPLGSTARTIGRVNSGLFGWRGDKVTETEVHESSAASSSAQNTGLMIAGAAILGVAVIALAKKKRA